MHKLQDSTGFNGFGETSWEAGDSSDASSRKAYFKELIAKANSIRLIRIFKIYGVRINEQNKKIICPFKSHSNGKESTPSFVFYPQTNTYCCYGCKQGSTPTDFVANMDNIPAWKAAYKIINLYGEDISPDIENDQESFSEKMRLYMEFSDYVYEFIQRNLKNDEALKFVEEITSIFDLMNSKRDLGNDALESLVFKLKDQIDRYSCPQL